jgi:hypothetical protein
LGLYFGGVLDRYSLITFKREISLGEISNLIIASFVGIYIPFFLEKKINNRRAEKDILIQLYSRVDTELRDLMRTMVDPIHISGRVIKRADSSTILVRSRAISNLLNLAVKNVIVYSKNKEIKNLTDELIRNQVSFKDNLTFNIKDRNPRIGPEIYMRLENDINEYTTNISAIIMRINDS